MAYSSVEIRCGGLSVEVSTEITYPDALDDICARTLTLFREGVRTAEEHGIDITVMSLHTTDYGDDDELDD